jgi:hypothetical protein
LMINIEEEDRAKQTSVNSIELNMRVFKLKTDNSKL